MNESPTFIRLGDRLINLKQIELIELTHRSGMCIKITFSSLNYILVHPESKEAEDLKAAMKILSINN